MGKNVLLSGKIKPRSEQIFSAYGDTEKLDIADLINVSELQTIMDNFYQLAKIPMAIIDTKGEVFVGVGWQDICLNFHRAHPATCRNCIESDTLLTSSIPIGEFKIYKCKNGMWDLATPIVVADVQIGNLFIGQFFFDNEPVDFDFFRAQAKKYGFDETRYLAALEHVPRLSSERLEKAKAFFLSLANSISLASFRNYKLSQSVADLKEAEKHLDHQSLLINNVNDAVMASDGEFRITYWNKAAERIYGWTAEEVLGQKGPELLRTEFIGTSRDDVIGKALEQGGYRTEVIHYHKNGRPITIESFFSVVTDNNRNITQYISVNRNITERKMFEAALHKAKNELEARVQERTKELSLTLANLAEEKKRFKDVLDMLPVYVALLDPDYNFVFTNKVFNDLFGSCMDKRCFEHLFGRDTPCENCRTYAVLKTELPNKWEWTAPNGRIYHVADFPITDTDGSRLILQMGEDITHKKGIEKYVMRKVFETEEANRRQFASDLHDDLGPTLSLIKMKLGMLNFHTHEDQQQVNITECEGLLADSVGKMREIANMLTPPLIDGFGLEAALNSFLKKIPQHGKTAISMQSNLDGFRFKKNTELHFYRIICELINNTLKHSGSTEAGINLDLTKDRLTMKYMDNGKGYSIEKIQDEKRGIGLYNILNRVNSFDGQIEFLKKKGKIQVVIRAKIV